MSTDDEFSGENEIVGDEEEETVQVVQFVQLVAEGAAQVQFAERAAQEGAVTPKTIKFMG